MPASADLSIVKRDPASLLFISFASTMYPGATNAELERATGIASRYFRENRASLTWHDDWDYYNAIADIAKALDGKSMAEAEQQLETVCEHLRGSDHPDVNAIACERWTPHIDAGILFGVWLGVHLALIANATEGEGSARGGVR